MKRKIFIAVLALFAVVAVNLCCYVFWGQYSTVKKIEQGKAVNAYEKFSILSMHSCLYLIGWMYSSDAALANMYMLTSHEDNKVYFHSDKWLPPIVIHEQLFYELEKDGILKPYQLICYYEIDE